MHGFKSLELVGEPIAKLTIPQIYRNLERDFCDVSIKNITVVSEVGQIYQVDLESVDYTPFEYIGYQDVHQLGRFYSLTINKKVTRLYTSVGFLDPRNLAFMQNFVKLSGNLIPEEEKLEGGKSRKVVLLMKKYETGKLTKQLIDG